MIHAQAVMGCLPILADILGRSYGVTIEIGGTEAFTTGRMIRLPSLPAASDPTFLGLVRGYIDHESAHIRFTDFKAISSASPSPLEKHIWNIFEDWRVERQLATLFPGCAGNFHWLIRHLFLGPRPLPQPFFLVIPEWLLLTVRSWSVPELAATCQDRAQIIDRHWPDLRSRLEEILAEMQKHCPDSQACLGYAKRVIACLKNSDKTRQNATIPDQDRLQPGKRRKGSADGQQGSGFELGELLRISKGALPDDMGKQLQTLLSNGSETAPDPCRVAGIGEKIITPLSADELDAIQRITAGMAARLSGLVQSERLVRQSPSRRGRLEPRRLHGIMTGNPKVFMTATPQPAMNTAVHILLDSSSSMAKYIRLAGQCCYAIATALERNGVSVGVTTFSGFPEGTVVPILSHGDRVHPRMGVSARGRTPLAEALWWTMQQIIHQPETRKVILIITDGLPNDIPGAKAAIQSASRLGVELYGLGIDTPKITDLLPGRTTLIDAIDRLPTALFGMMQRAVILKGQEP